MIPSEWLEYSGAGRELHTVFLHTVEIKDDVDIGRRCRYRYRYSPNPPDALDPCGEKANISKNDSDLYSVGAHFSKHIGVTWPHAYSGESKGEDSS